MNDKIEYLKGSGAVFLPAGNSRALELANAAFQQMKASILPQMLMDFYLSHSGAILGDAVVFPTEETTRANHSIPGIVQINRDLSVFPSLRGKTVWGRNTLYLFSVDVTGTMYMHDVLTLQILRKYADFSAALSDCLLVGKV